MEFRTEGEIKTIGWCCSQDRRLWGVVERDAHQPARLAAPASFHYGDHRTLWKDNPKPIAFGKPALRAFLLFLSESHPQVLSSFQEAVGLFSLRKIAQGLRPTRGAPPPKGGRTL